MKKITILYADDLEDIDFKQDYKHEFGTFIDENEYAEQRQSKRIEWVNNMVKQAMRRKTKTAIATNDYWFMRLVENATPTDSFCIYHQDVDKHFSNFVDMKPNPTLDVGTHIFHLSVRKALKQ